ncbi:dihydroneopterin aldolase [Flexibacterium corallicola]|uniref:dihydroneopterin aldolase n=1 Tax=Flexibacterium corallicola TaxID=3037259 RepID=UPI00286FA12F|nr:dihydroneopterin aldolase [Pseudovibrio sp. M1P-2-3]
MDAIHLENLSFFAYHGLYEEEAQLGQRFIVDLTCWVDLEKASQTDAYEDTICYGALSKTVEKIVTTQRFNLIERLGGAICEGILQQDSRIQSVKVRVHKPGAPVPVACGAFSVEINRSRS